MLLKRMEDSVDQEQKTNDKKGRDDVVDSNAGERGEKEKSNWTKRNECVDG